MLPAEESKRSVIKCQSGFIDYNDLEKEGTYGKKKNYFAAHHFSIGDGISSLCP
jgi:hypothetical protein